MQSCESCSGVRSARCKPANCANRWKVQMGKVQFPYQIGCPYFPQVAEFADLHFAHLHLVCTLQIYTLHICTCICTFCTFICTCKIICTCICTLQIFSCTFCTLLQKICTCICTWRFRFPLNPSKICEAFRERMKILH